MKLLILLQLLFVSILIQLAVIVVGRHADNDDTNKHGVVDPTTYHRSIIKPSAHLRGGGDRNCDDEVSGLPLLEHATNALTLLP